MFYLFRIHKVSTLLTELIHPSWGSSTHNALKWMTSKHKTDTVLNDETFDIERDLCAFGHIGGGTAPI